MTPTSASSSELRASGAASESSGGIGAIEVESKGPAQGSAAALQRVGRGVLLLREQLEVGSGPVSAQRFPLRHPQEGDLVRAPNARGMGNRFPRPEVALLACLRPGQGGCSAAGDEVSVLALLERHVVGSEPV